ncbi:MAG: fimbria/pilus periplasmic chaperone [Pseudomonadota bacterium]
MTINHRARRSWQAVMAFAIALCSPYAWALKVGPMTGEWVLSATDHYELTVVNDKETTAPIKITALSRTQDANGIEVRTPSDDLVIFPGQFLVKPNEQRVVRISLKKKLRPQIELAYRIIAEEIATKDVALKGSGVRFVTRFVTAMYIVPERPQPQIEFISARRESEGFSFTLKNTGNIHHLLSRPILKFTQHSVVQILDNPEELKPIPLTNLLPGTTHTVAWRWPGTALRPLLDLSRDYRVDMSWDCPHCKKDRASLDIKVE